MSRFLLAFIRNCGVAIAISVFFAAARGPSHPPRPGAADTPAVEVRGPESIVPAPKKPACDQPAYRVCRLVDAAQQMPERAQ